VNEHASRLILFAVALGVAWIVGCAIGHVESGLTDRRRVCSLAREYRVTWLWFESTATIRRRVAAAIGGLHPMGNPLRPALLAIPGVRDVSFALDGPGSVTATVNTAWWMRLRPRHRAFIEAVVERTKPSMVTVRTVIR
jgi:hypothetical protein